MEAKKDIKYASNTKSSIESPASSLSSLSSLDSQNIAAMEEIVNDKTDTGSISLMDKFMGSLQIKDGSSECTAPGIDQAFAKTVANKMIMRKGTILTRSPSAAGSMFEDLFDGGKLGSGGVELESTPLEAVNDCSNDNWDKNCKICSHRLVGPRVLSCLHVFCEACLKKLLSAEELSASLGASTTSSSSSSTSSSSGMESANVPSITATPKPKSFIECPVCKQITMLSIGGVESLTCDYILTNILDLSTIESEKLSCTSCKSKEKAISRCNDCANFLCGGCDNAHKYMRCFENHEVVKFEDLKNGSGADKPKAIHKPLLCNIHAGENLKYYCFNCQIPVCNDCLIADHKGSEHHYDLVTAAEKSVRTDIEGLLKEAKLKVQYCDNSASNLSSALTELQAQHDSARQSIEDAYQCYKKILENCRDRALNELGRLHSERELKVMDLLQNIENTMGKIDGTCKFAARVLDQANAAELLSLKKLVSEQFISLINSTPKCEINYSLTFDTNTERFEQVMKESFGKFRTESSPPSPKESTPPPTLPGVPHSIVSTRSGSNGSGLGNSSATINGGGKAGTSATASSPISMPNSMQSSFDGELSAMNNGFLMHNVLSSESTTTAAHQHQNSGQTGNHPSVQHNGVYNSVMSLGLGQVGGICSNQSNLNMLDVSGATSSTHNVMINTSIGGNNLTSALGNSISGGRVIGGSINATPVTAAPPPPAAFNSILEYNISRLASLTEPNHTETIGDTLAVGHHHPLGQNQTITLADLLSGDQRAFNNLQALAKLGLNNNAPSPSLMGPQLGSTVSGTVGAEDMVLSNFHANAPSNTANIITGRNKATPMQIRCKFGSLGTSKGQFNSPHGFCLGVDEEIIVADTNNHRIEIFDKSGNLKFYFGVPGKEEGQLWYPRKVAVMPTNGKFVVCDRGNERSRMQIFSKLGHFMRKIAIRYIDIVAGLAVTSKGHIVAVDSVSPTVFVISEDGELVRWFDCSDYMREPSDIAIRDNDFYVCDFKGHCVAVFHEDGTFQYRIGNEKVTCFPNGIDISNAGDILIGDSHGNRFHVACYSRDGILQSEFECPHVKVSRCCGLKITSEGYVVTLAKNNHHVLVLNTLYVH